jgi:hypothetical protein
LKPLDRPTWGRAFDELMADAVPGHAHAADADLELADLSELDPTRESGDDPIGLE